MAPYPGHFAAGPTRRCSIRDGAVAGLFAGALSGLPSTAVALLRGDDPLAATLAAGALACPHEARRGRLLAAAVPTHIALSLAWGVVLSSVLPRRHTVAFGTAAGLAIAALDLGVVGRRYARIRELPTLPQVADHLAFGALAGAALVHRRGR